MKEIGDIIPQQWASPCGSQCTHKYAALTQIPWRVFCKKGCGADGDTWNECVSVCDQICYKDPVLKDQQWSACIDRSPGDASYSEFEMPAKKVEECHPNRPSKPPAVPKFPKAMVVPQAPAEDDVPGTSA